MSCLNVFFRFIRSVFCFSHAYATFNINHSHTDKRLFVKQ